MRRNELVLSAFLDNQSYHTQRRHLAAGHIYGQLPSLPSAAFDGVIGPGTTTFDCCATGFKMLMDTFVAFG